MTERLDITEYALLLARTAAARSEDPYHKVGCALVRHDNTVAGLGYNGPPPGVEITWENRDHRRLRVVHAEANALRYVQPGEVKFAATTMMPCATCVLLLRSYGVKSVWYFDELDPVAYPVAETLRIADEVGVDLCQMEER